MAYAPEDVEALDGLLLEPGRTAVVSGVSKDPNGKVTLLLLARDGRYPAVVAKVAPTRAAERALEHEAAVLRGFDRRRLGVIAPTVPTVLGWSRHRQCPVLLIGGLPGRNMLSSYHGWRHTATPNKVRDDFRSVGAWLAAFSAATAGEPTSLADGSLLATLTARFAHDPFARDVPDLLHAVQRELGVYTVPSCVAHGDLWAGNVLESQGSVSGVVDWEAASVTGTPLADVVRFAITYALYLDRHTRPGAEVAGHRGLRAGRWGAGIRYMITFDSWFGDLAEEFVGASLSRAGASAELWRSALVEGLACIAATADDPAFAARHLELFTELAPAALEGRPRRNTS